MTNPTHLRSSGALKRAMLNAEPWVQQVLAADGSRIRFDAMTIAVSLFEVRVGYRWRGRETGHVIYPLEGVSRGNTLTINVDNLNGDMPFKLE